MRRLGRCGKAHRPVRGTHVSLLPTQMLLASINKYSGAPRVLF
jgi:hypothetical protein